MAGRPLKKIDVEQLEMCAQKQWSDVEIAAFFRVSVKTLHRRYVQVIADARQRGKTKLRDLQWKRAMEGSDRVLLHMSQHYLGQENRTSLNISQVPDEVFTQEAERRLNASKESGDS